MHLRFFYTLEIYLLTCNKQDHYQWNGWSEILRLYIYIKYRHFLKSPLQSVLPFLF